MHFYLWGLNFAIMIHEETVLLRAYCVIILRFKLYYLFCCISCLSFEVGMYFFFICINEGSLVCIK